VTTPDRVIIWNAGVQWDDVRGTDWHLATRLAPHIPVLWVDPPLSVVHALRTGAFRRLLRRGGVTSVGPSITRLTVLAPPFSQRRAVLWLTEILTSWALQRVVRSLGWRVVAQVVTSPRQRNRLDGGTRVYFATDDFTAGARLMGTRERTVRHREHERVEEADCVLAVSPEILERFDVSDKVSAVLPNGCDPVHYAHVDEAPWPHEVRLSRPVAGVVGQLSRRIDLSILEELAVRGVSLLLVGPVDGAFEPERFQALVSRPNVDWVGLRPFDELPSYLRAMDVGLTPYVDSSFNRASFPLKTLEYLAAGRSVVSTRLPATDRLATPLVRSADTRAEFVELTLEALAEERTEELAALRRQFAALHSWEQRARDFLRLTGLEV
jgi:teichuronic acid biosynthesis glycosyltransferase TuaH